MTRKLPSFEIEKKMQFKYEKKEESTYFYSANLSNEFLNPFNIIHGGSIATLFDNAMGRAAYQITNQIPLTQNINIDYVNKANLGQFIIQVKQQAKTKKTILLKAKILQKQEIIAFAKAMFFLKDSYLLSCPIIIFNK